MKLAILIVVSGLAVLAAGSGMELYQKAVTQERAGKMEEAIKLYEKVAHDFAPDRALAAKALVQAARGYEKLGQDGALKLYERVAREYGDQREYAQAAQAKLMALRQPAAATMTLRKIEIGDLDIIATDGERAIYQDDSGTVFSSDVAARSKQVVFKPRAEDLAGLQIVVSRDLSMIFIVLNKPGGQQVYAVMQSDGTGYRELARRQGTAYSRSWSWDNRFVLLPELALDASGKPTSRLFSFSVGDGQIRNLLTDTTVRFIGPTAVASPDGRFVAFDFGTPGAQNIFVAPIEGGERRVVAEGGVLLDWPKDGHFLAFASRRSGSMALYLLPMRDGRPAGEPQFVRNGFVFCWFSGVRIRLAWPHSSKWGADLRGNATHGDHDILLGHTGCGWPSRGLEPLKFAGRKCGGSTLSPGVVAE